MIVGREAELERIDGFLGAVADGPATLLLEGELGVGKSALWHEAVARSPYRVLACRPVEAETQLAYAALGDLLAELSGDDLQWLDHPSEVVLGFVARRLASARVGLLGARRGGGAMPLHLPETARVTVGPLAPDALARMLVAHGPVSRPELARVARASGGNPYFALELVGHETVPEGLRGLVADRLAALPPEGREAAALAAVLARPTTSLVDAAAAPGVLEIDGSRVRFAHPLLSSIAYEQVADQRALHARAAACVDDPEERARHLALAADAPDEDVASALVDAARA